jgi:hypothetical protein
MCSGCPDGSSENTGKVLDIVPAFRFDDVLGVSCAIADDRGNITQLVGYR